MAVRANYIKLGLFVVVGVGVAIALAITVGALELRRETIPYVTYFGESVQGLEVGTAVKARGVTVGRVGHITFAPDHEMVQVRMDLDAATMRAMGTRPGQPSPNVRAQLASSGLVGSRFISLDLFNPERHPAPPLTFTPAGRYIPSTPSVQKTLEASAARLLEKLSLFVDTLVAEGVAEKTSHALSELDAVLREVEQTMRSLNREKLPARTAKVLDDFRATVATMNVALQNLDEHGGNALAAAQRAFATIGEVGRRTSAGTRDLPRVLDELRAAAAALRELADQVQQNPDMLVKGKKTP